MRTTVAGWPLAGVDFFSGGPGGCGSGHGRLGDALRRRRILERGILAQDRLLELSERLPRLHRELVDQRPSRLLEGLERLRLTAAPVQGEHQLTLKPLAERVLADEDFELGDHLLMTAGGELGVDQLLARVEPELLETGDRALRERLVGEVGQRVTAPQRLGLGEQRHRILGAAGGQCRAGGVVQSLEPVGIELVPAELEHVARRAREQPVAGRRHRSPQPRHEHVEGVDRGRRRVLSPDVIHEPVDGDDLIRVDRQHGEHGSLTRAA